MDFNELFLMPDIKTEAIILGVVGIGIILLIIILTIIKKAKDK